MTTRPAMLLITDDAAIRDQVREAFSSVYELIAVSDSAVALARLHQTMPPLVLLDLSSFLQTDGVSEGMAVLHGALRLNPATKVIVVMPNKDRATAITAFETGAYDVLELPMPLDVLKVVLQRAIYLSNLEREHHAFQEQTGRTELEGLVGNSRPMQDIFDMIRRIGPADVPILITGESGTGKELVAHAVHKLRAYPKTPAQRRVITAQTT